MGAVVRSKLFFVPSYRRYKKEKRSSLVFFVRSLSLSSFHFISQRSFKSRSLKTYEHDIYIYTHWKLVDRSFTIGSVFRRRKRKRQKRIDRESFLKKIDPKETALETRRLRLRVSFFYPVERSRITADRSIPSSSKKSEHLFGRAVAPLLPSGCNDLRGIAVGRR